MIRIAQHGRVRGRLGAFEGANYEARGFFRPQADCIMFTRGECRSAPPAGARLRRLSTCIAARHQSSSLKRELRALRDFVVCFSGGIPVDRDS